MTNQTNTEEVKPAICSSKFCKMRSRGVIEFSPSGEQGETHRLSLAEIDSRPKLDEFIRNLVKANIDLSNEVPLDALNDLVDFYGWTTNPRNIDGINRQFERAEGIGLIHGKYLQELPNGDIELRVDGEIKHKLSPGTYGLTDLSEIWDQPWLTADVKSELLGLAVGYAWTAAIQEQNPDWTP